MHYAYGYILCVLGIHLQPEDVPRFIDSLFNVVETWPDTTTRRGVRDVADNLQRWMNRKLSG